MTKLTHARLLEVAVYDPKSGHFYARVRRATLRVGDSMGSVTRRGYLNIHIDDRQYYAHRLAWFYVRGRWPKGEIDHRDRCRTNNAIGNLRDASRRQNNANARARPKVQGSLKGAYWVKAKQRWRAQIGSDGRAIFLGYFRSEAAAHAAYLAKSRELHGDFARAA